jgi:hypothetical protein
MAGTTKQTMTDAEPQSNNLAYWMGRVDANLGEMKASIATLISNSENQWTKFEAWRAQVEERLQTGNAKFDEYDRRIKALENAKTAREEEEENPKAKFGSWDWFRDKYIENFLIIVITIILLKVVEIIVANWNIGAR